MKRPDALIVSVALGLLLLSASARAAEQKTALMLGGDYCELHQKELTAALTAVKGVSKVDLTSMEGHAVVSHDETVKEETLIKAVESVKGTKDGVEWYCSAMVME